MTSPYSLFVMPTAGKEIDSLPGHVRQRVRRVIEGLAQDPHPPRSKNLREPLEHLHRLPVEQWRVIYEIEEDIRTVTVVTVRLKTGPETYEDLI